MRNLHKKVHKLKTLSNLRFFLSSTRNQNLNLSMLGLGDWIEITVKWTNLGMIRLLFYIQSYKVYPNKWSYLPSWYNFDRCCKHLSLNIRQYLKKLKTKRKNHKYLLNGVPNAYKNIKDFSSFGKRKKQNIQTHRGIDKKTYQHKVHLHFQNQHHKLVQNIRMILLY